MITPSTHSFERREFLGWSLSPLCAALLSAGCVSTQQQPTKTASLSLVSKQEVDQYKDDWKENMVIPLSGDGPSIEVLRPVIKDGKVATPVAIEVRFKAPSGKTIDTSSFKLYYGAFKIDVTDRLLKTVKVSPNGFALDTVDIPKGSHRLVMKINDNDGTAGLREIKFTVDA